MKKNPLVMALVGIGFAAVGVYFGLHAPGANAPAVNGNANAFVTTTAGPGAPGSVAPAVASLLSQSMPDTSGGMQRLAKWTGKPLVVNFWATWCGPCVEEMPALSALQAEVAPKNIQILGIGIDSPGNIREFAAKYKIAYPVYVAGMGGTDLSRQFGDKAGSLPYTVLVSADGRIVKTYLGKLKMDELRRDIAGL